MKARARGTVESIEAEREGAQEIRVRVGGELRAAIVYPALTGRVAIGDTVTLNTWAMELGLGTGGVDFVTEACAGDAEAEPPGHILKLRYTPMQLPVLSAESPESPHHESLREFESLDGTPVVCAELHSQLPAITAAAKWETKGAARVVYVMTDGAALPLAFSRLVPTLVGRGLLDATVTAGQAFGGDFEAVNLYSALAVARAAARADIIVVCQGPGNTGTATPLGFSGIDQGIALNAAASLNGTPIAVARLSFADLRPRHIGISHHTRTVLDRVAMCSVMVPLPRLPMVEAYHLRRALEAGRLLERHEFFTVDAEVGLNALLASGIPVTTMGRGINEERAFFLAAAAAGLLAGQWVSGTAETAVML
jgi:hypothetical protein